MKITGSPPVRSEQDSTDEKKLIISIVNTLEVSTAENSWIQWRFQTDNIQRFRSAFSRYLTAFNNAAGTDRKFTISCTDQNEYTAWRIK